MLVVATPMKSWIYAGFGLLVLFHLGAIRKDEDPILKTQTDPISYKQKLEETKDGVKGAPAPSFTYYQKEEFLVKTPMGTGKEQAAAEAVRETAEVSEVDFTNETDFEGEDLAADGLVDGEEAAEEEEWWLEDEETEEQEETEEFSEEA